MATKLSITLSSSLKLNGFIDTHPLSAKSTVSISPLSSNLPVTKFLGVPFASAPRFGISELLKDEQGEIDCFEFGDTPLQPLKGAIEQFWVNKPGWLNRDHIKASEDCLNLNIFLPTETISKFEKEGNKTLLPVLVWVYGGALNTGHAAACRHDPTELVRELEKRGTPTVVITANYRVNIFGFLTHPDLKAANDGESGNAGFWDQIRLLEWVALHKRSFNGGEVSLVGESAGAYSITSLPTSPYWINKAEPLAIRIIAQSGSPSTMCFRNSKDYVYPMYDKMLKEFGLDKLAPAEERVEGLRNLKAEEVLKFGEVNGRMGIWGGVYGEGELFEVEPERAFREGKFDKRIKEFVLGCNRDEGTLFVGLLQLLKSPDGVTNFINAQNDCATALHDLYAPVADSKFVDEPICKLLGDQVFIAPKLTLSANLLKHGMKVKQFQFNELLPDMSTELADFGSYHGIEIPFLFRTTTFWQKGSSADLTSLQMINRYGDLLYDQGDWSEVGNGNMMMFEGGKSYMELETVDEQVQKRRDFWCARINAGHSVGLGN